MQLEKLQGLPRARSVIALFARRDNSADLLTMIFWRKKSTTRQDQIETPKVIPPGSIEAPEPEAVESKAPVPFGPRKKILVVDDDPVTIHALSRKLTSRGFEVVTAANGSQALNATRRERPDLMLLDVNLPPDVGCVEWNGFRLAQWLQRMEEGRNVPVIVMSAFNRDEYRETAMLAGATAFFCKQTDNDQMLATIESALRGKTTVAVSNQATPVFEI
jgi:CheY-like chemotaxis protein